MYIKKRQNLFAIFVTMVTVFAMMLITTGTVYAEEQMEPIEIINECGEEGELLIQDPATGIAITQSAAESEILITFLGGKQLDPSDPNYNEPDPDTNSKPIYLIATAITTDRELYNAQIGHNEMVVIRIPYGGARIRLTYDSGSTEIVDISGATVTGISDKSYTGKALTQSPTVKVGDITLKSGTDYTLSYQNNINAGTATVIIAGKGNCTGSISKIFKIKPRAITPAVTLSTAAYTYSGALRTPSVTVIDGSTVLKKNTDYTVSYASGRKNVGTYKVTVKLNGNYSGSKVVAFKINKAANNLSVKAKTAAVKYTAVKKKAQTLAVSKVISFTKTGQGAKTYTKVSGNKNIIINAKTGKVTIKKGLKKGTYKIKVKVKAAGTANYKAITKTITFTVKIK